jgi:hypothetical protein
LWYIWTSASGTKQTFKDFLSGKIFR